MARETWVQLPRNERPNLRPPQRASWGLFLLARSKFTVGGWAARLGWGLPYYYARMTCENKGDEIAYETRRSGTGERHSVRYRIGDGLGPSEPETIEHFLLERYLLFVDRSGGILVGQVHHEPYPVQRVDVLHVNDELVQAAGLPQPSDPPCYAHYSAGVDVEVFGLREC